MYKGFAMTPKPLAAMLDNALELVALAATPEAAGCAERICAYDMLICVYDQLDHRGYANEILRLCDRLAREVTPAQQCYYCLANQRANTLRVLDRTDEAGRTCETMLAELRTSSTSCGVETRFFNEHHRLGTLLLLGLIAVDRGDRDEAAQLLVDVAPRTRRLAPTFLARYYLLQLRLSQPLLDVAVAIGDEAIRQLPHNSHPLAQVCFEVGRELAQNGAVSTALRYATHAKQIADYLGALALQVETQELIATVHEHMGASRRASQARSEAEHWAALLQRLHERPRGADSRA